MKTHFRSDFFSGNRQSLRERIKRDALVVVAANGVLQRSADTTFPFAQERNFWYLTGIDTPDVVLIMNGSDEFLILPPANATRDVFDGRIDTNQLIQQSGISEVLPHAVGWKKLKAVVQKQPDVYTIRTGPLYERNHGMYLNPARQRLQEQLRRISREVDLKDVRAEITRLRSIKQQPEIEAIREAVHITTESVDTVRKAAFLKACVYEYELEAMLSAEFRRLGASGHAYTPIVANGANATVLHYVANNAQLYDDRLTVVDVGAEYSHYAADITRTLCATKLTKRQQNIVTAVREVQQYALSLLKPGCLLRDYEKQVAGRMGKALQSLGLVARADDTAAVRRYYPHATSHFLGLDVHDVGAYEQPLAEGMVLTCEPGIYIPEEGIGVRLEDDILITSDGHENLSANCSYEPYVL